MRNRNLPSSCSIPKPSRRRPWHQALRLIAASVLMFPAALIAQQYQQKILVSATQAEGTNPLDPDLKNPWGIARGTGSPWWISDNVTGVSTLYDGKGVKQSLRVTIPHTSFANVGSPTGIVFNGSSDFAVTPGNPGICIFVSIDGTIPAWSPIVELKNAIWKVPGSTKSVLTCTTSAHSQAQRSLYGRD